MRFGEWGGWMGGSWESGKCWCEAGMRVEGSGVKVGVGGGETHPSKERTMGSALMRLKGGRRIESFLKTQRAVKRNPLTR